MESKQNNFKQLIIIVLAAALAYLIKLKYIDGKDKLEIVPDRKEISDGVQSTPDKTGISITKTIAAAKAEAEEAVTSAKEISSSLEKEEVYKVVEQAPRFPGCENETTSDEKKKCADEKMLEFLYKNIKYPLAAKVGSIQGRVVITFVVEKDGSISNAKVIRGIGGGCDEESLRVVNSMNEMKEKWTPGRQKGNPVQVQFNLPISFKLS